MQSRIFSTVTVFATVAMTACVNRDLGTGSASGGSSGGSGLGAVAQTGGAIGSGGTSAGGAAPMSGGATFGGSPQSMSGSTSVGGSGGTSMGGATVPSGGALSGGSGGKGGSSGSSGNSANSGNTGKGGDAGKGGNASKGGNAGSTGSGGKSTGGAGSGSVTQPPPITNGTPAWASRYWDCCKPACGWEGNVQSGGPMTSCNQQNQSLGGDYAARNACDSGGSAFMCWNGVPWAVSDTLAYGFAAASGANYQCGRCFQLQFTGSGHHGANAGAQSLNGKTMIVQVINNGGVASDQFDLLIPGGGVGQLNACSAQWGTSDLGEQYGGFLAGCSGDRNCVQQKCQQVFAGKTDLLAGCDWFLNWFAVADNPNLVYRQIACPTQITQRSGLQDPG